MKSKFDFSYKVYWIKKVLIIGKDVIFEVLKFLEIQYYIEQVTKNDMKSVFMK